MADNRFNWWLCHYCDENKITNKEIETIKRELRKEAHKISDRRLIYSNDIDYYTLLIEFPPYVQTNEDAEEYFDCNERMECILGPYDCTGQHFTIRHKLVYRESTGTWWCYHYCGIDC